MRTRLQVSSKYHELNFGRFYQKNFNFKKLDLDLVRYPVPRGEDKTGTSSYILLVPVYFLFYLPPLKKIKIEQ